MDLTSTSTINKEFFFELFRGVSRAYVLVLFVGIIYIYFMQQVDHNIKWFPMFILLAALAKTVYFTFFTFRQVHTCIRKSHSFWQILWVFSLLIFLIILSFAADFNCLSFAQSEAFSGITSSPANTDLGRLFEFFYFSIITFASVGYGDIAPVSTVAKILVILEIGQSFVMVVFGLSNVNNIRMRIHQGVKE